MQQKNSSALLSLIQHFRKLDWDKALCGISQAEYLILTAIRHGQESCPKQPGVYVSVVADYLMTSASMVSKLLKILEGRGWILRTVDPKSRRNTFVSLTDQGKAILDRTDLQMDQINQLVEKKLGEETRQQLVQNLSTLFSCYEEVLGQA